jgi:hypothetical protein
MGRLKVQWWRLKPLSKGSPEAILIVPIMLALYALFHLQNQFPFLY